jgi:hypothetical protein
MCGHVQAISNKRDRAKPEASNNERLISRLILGCRVSNGGDGGAIDGSPLRDCCDDLRSEPAIRQSSVASRVKFR